MEEVDLTGGFIVGEVIIRNGTVFECFVSYNRISNHCKVYCRIENKMLCVFVNVTDLLPIEI